jgi:hypothetical protein
MVLGAENEIFKALILIEIPGTPIYEADAASGQDE